MKKQYVIYRIIDGDILLLLSGRGYWSGYLLQEYDQKRDCIGSLFIYEGEDTPVEQLFFCKTQKIINSVELENKLFGPTWFPVHAPPLEEMDSVQKSVISLVLQSQPFKGTMHFKDKKRIHLQHVEIHSCSLEDLLV